MPSATAADVAVAALVAVNTVVTGLLARRTLRRRATDSIDRRAGRRG